MSSTKIQTFGGNVGIGTNDPGDYRLSITGGTASLQDLTVTTSFTVNSVSAAFVPSGLIIMWAGDTIPTGWSLCDGTNGTPDLTDRFVVSSGTTYSQGDSGGSTTKTITASNMPGHSHTCTTGTSGNHSHPMTVSTYNTLHNHTASLGQELTGNHTISMNSNTGAHSHSIGTGNHNHAHYLYSNYGGNHRHNQGLLRIHDSANGIDGYGNYPARSHSMARYPGWANSKAHNSCNVGNHTHNIGVNNSGGHGHNWNAANTDGAHTHNAVFTAGGAHSHPFSGGSGGSHTHVITSDASGQHTHGTSNTDNTGQGTAFSILPPYYALAFIMKD